MILKVDNLGEQKLKVLEKNNVWIINCRLVAGLISFLSPCVLPLIPGYISYISGSTFNVVNKKKKI